MEIIPIAVKFPFKRKKERIKKMSWQDKLEDFLRRGIDFDIAVQEVAESAPAKNDLLNLRRTEKNRIENTVRAGYSLREAFQTGLDDRYTANLYERYFIG